MAIPSISPDDQKLVEELLSSTHADEEHLMRSIVITFILVLSAYGAFAADSVKPFHLLVITADDMHHKAARLIRAR
ncbi:MAG: hypothetical protein O3A37_06975 [Planctomycetota bacterium]|nr:hypothetical protein [Planctomycetota bacterium]